MKYIFLKNQICPNSWIYETWKLVDHFLNCYLCICMSASAYLFDRCIHGKFIGIFFCFTEDNGSTVAAAVDLDHVTEHSCPLWPVARYGQMLQRKEKKGGQKEKQIETGWQTREGEETFSNITAKNAVTLVKQYQSHTRHLFHTLTSTVVAAFCVFLPIRSTCLHPGLMYFLATS